MSVTAARGFKASGVAARISKLGPDLALVVGRRRMRRRGDVHREPRPGRTGRRQQGTSRARQPQAVVINSGNANAATGAQGVADARATAAEAARVLGLEPEQVLVLSTGVIGVPLPMERLLPGIAKAAAALSSEGGAAAAQAILTTDTCTKEAVAHGDGFTVGGMAKGSGMIHPNLATMLAVITTDYPLEPGEPIEFLRPAVEESFNSISVDGECSTNDAVVLLSSGAGKRTGDGAFRDCPAHGMRRARAADRRRRRGRDGRRRDQRHGRGVAAEAKAVARRIATSPLVKTALFGKDANWGRVLAAAGSAPYNGGYAQLDPSLVTLCYNGTKVLEHGAPLGSRARRERRRRARSTSTSASATAKRST